jgi:3-deoxy-D-manno-octulosonate 8-phosphate phosphatase (KDO 8-P phosphatase)
MLQHKLKRIKLLVCDVDGVLTDGTIIYHDDGSETKIFNVKDGLGIRLLRKAGIGFYIVTGRRSAALYHRCRNLGIDRVFDNVKDKAVVFDRIVAQSGVVGADIAFIGDDIPDLGLMKKVGLPIAVNDAHEMVVKHADMVTSSAGGHGAVREVCEAILKAQGIWDALVERFS